MNSILWRIQNQDEEPTLYDVIGLLEDILRHAQSQSERTLKLHERVSQMSYEMSNGFIAARVGFGDIRRTFEKDKENMNFQAPIHS